MLRVRLMVLATSTLLLAAAPALAWVSTFHRQGAVTAVQATPTGDVVANPGSDVVKLRGSDGKTLWTAPDISTGYGSTPALGGPSLALDGAGDVLAAGTSFGSSSNAVHVTKLKGDTGMVLWAVDVMDGAGTAVAGDGAGDVIVAGFGSLGFEIAKLAGTDGSPIWEYDLAGGFAVTVAVDGQGNVLAAGHVPNPPNDDDFLVVKLDGTTGGELWRYLRDGGAGKGDAAVAIAIDANGDVAAAGTGRRGVAIFDFTVVKLSGADGSEQWHYTTVGDDPGYFEAQADAVAFDAAGDVVAAGEAPQSGNTVDLAVVKLSGATGTELWRRALHGTASSLNTDHAYRVAVDSAGNAIAAGYLSNEGNTPVTDNEDFSIVKLDGATGDQLWRAEINGKTTSFDRAYALALDAADNVVAGGTVASNNYDAVAVKISDRIAGRKLGVSDHGDPDHRKIGLTASGRGLLVVPAETGVGDPTVSGATLQLLNPTSGEQTTIALPAELWSRLGSAASAGHGYKYKDPGRTQGPCYSLVLTPASLKATCRGAGIDFSLDEPSQGSLGVVLTTGANAGKYCMLFGSPTRDGAGGFISQTAPQPPACPTVPPID